MVRFPSIGVDLAALPSISMTSCTRMRTGLALCQQQLHASCTSRQISRITQKDRQSICHPPSGHLQKPCPILEWAGGVCQGGPCSFSEGLADARIQIRCGDHHTAQNHTSVEKSLLRLTSHIADPEGRPSRTVDHSGQVDCLIRQVDHAYQANCIRVAR